MCGFMVMFIINAFDLLPGLKDMRSKEHKRSHGFLFAFKKGNFRIET